MNKRWRNIGLTALLVLAIVVIAPAFLGGGNTQQEARTMRYSDFVEAVEDNQISRVLISPDRGTAQVVENDGRRAQVNLAPDKELLGLHNLVQQAKELYLLLCWLKKNFEISITVIVK